MASKRHLTEEQNERVRAVLRRAMDAQDADQVEIARQLGMSQSTMSRFLRAIEPSGTSLEVLLRVADMFDVPASDLLGVHDGSVSEDDRYPHRARAIAVARSVDGITTTAIDRVRQLAYEGDDITTREWLRLIMDAQDRLDRGLPP